MAPYRTEHEEAGELVELTDCQDCAMTPCKRTNDAEQWVPHTQYFRNGELYGGSWASACQYFSPSRLVRIARRFGHKKPRMHNPRTPIQVHLWVPTKPRDLVP